MIPTEKEEEEVETSTGKSALTTSRPSCSKIKDPRIARVSRAFGTKDRHSKVYTVRGLRDRRVRLSVQTAIQLYDLQERLGLNQPSKVVDWLLNVAKNEIDELPPLEFPQGGSLLQHQQQNISFDPFSRWDPSNLTLSHPPRSFDLGISENHHHHHHQEMHNSGVVQWQSQSQPSIPSHQVVVYHHQHGVNGLQLQQPVYFPFQQPFESELSSISLALPVESSSRNGRAHPFHSSDHSD